MPLRSHAHAAAILCATAACPNIAIAADADSLLGIHFWGDRNDAAPAQLLNTAARGAYDVEIVNTGNPEWNDVDVVSPLYANFKNNYHVTPVTRLGYYWGNTLPTPAQDANWAATIANNVVAPLKNTAHLWQLGNEPNLRGEASAWANQQITPAAYAAQYQSVRNALQSPALLGSAGAHKLLVAPVSPGGVAGDRWLSGADWLGQTITAIQSAATPIDGFALHAYGGQPTAAGSLRDFRLSLLDQIRVIDQSGLTSAPLYVTEWNRFTPYGNAAEEAVTADFARRALKWLDRWNRTPGNHNVVSASWFVYEGSSGSGWDNYSIEYWKNHGAGPGSAGSLHQAFYDAARAGYRAGIAGTRPMPAGVQVIDDFEGSDGHFNAPTSGSNAGLSGAFKTYLGADTDSYTKFGAQKIGLTDAPAPGGWKYRHVSGTGGLPSNNLPITLSAGVAQHYIGFMLRVLSVNGSEDTSAANGAMTVQLVMDSGPAGGGNNSDAGKPLPVIADGEWHLYQWNLRDAADWVPWEVTASDGKLGTNADFLGQVSIDSLWIKSAADLSVEFMFDTVMQNPTGDLSAMLPVPEPSSLLALSTLPLAIRRRRCA